MALPRRPLEHLADVEDGEGRGHHGRGAHLIDGERRRPLGVGVVQSVAVVLHGDLRQLLHRRPELEHVAAHHHGVVAGVEAAHRVIEVGVGGERNELVPLPGVDPPHGLEPHGEADLHAPGGDRLPGRLEAEPPGRPSPLDAARRLGVEPQVILHHGARHELAREVVREVGADRAVDLPAGKAGEVAQGVVEGLADHEAEILLGMGLGELGDAARNHVHRSHDAASSLSSALAISRRWISEVPSPISVSFASRK